MTDSGATSAPGSLYALDIRRWFSIAAGWLAACASVGVSVALFDSGAFDLFESSDAPAHSAALTLFVYLVPLLLVLVPVASAYLPTTHRFDQLPKAVRRIVISLWGLWLVVSLPGWVTLLSWFGPDENGGVGMAITFLVAPAALGAFLVPVAALAGEEARLRRCVALGAPNNGIERTARR